MPLISVYSTNAPKLQTCRLAKFSKIAHVALLWSAFCASAHAQTACPVGTSTQDFAFTGAQASYVVPTGATQIALQAFGAQGNAGAGTQGGAGALGGAATGTLATTPGQTLYVFVGGQGNTCLRWRQWWRRIGCKGR
jgi:trimeric autotransporter adhesin